MQSFINDVNKKVTPPCEIIQQMRDVLSETLFRYFDLSLQQTSVNQDSI